MPDVIAELLVYKMTKPKSLEHHQVEILCINYSNALTAYYLIRIVVKTQRDS